MRVYPRNPSVTAAAVALLASLGRREGAMIEVLWSRAMRIALPALLGMGSMLAATAADAHHAFATEFSVDRPVTLEGRVARVELINPHSWIHIEVVDENGETAVWMIEGGSPNALVRRGITKASIPIGSELVVRGYQARDGSNRAVGRNLRFADGRELFFQGTQATD